ncbi:hypothetical protein A2906_02975 [Candidatus Nomurabacteria bacterium RIFCSPLOWO2_01_FULL_37_25]|nr:MAG: hypothetical protein A2906_02975 [Candidatus Nomurabacteria bacterium RIFCSPLOWO2_01_FULL_37_25]
MPNENEQISSGVKINRAKLGSISLYDVTEDELSLLERGSPASTYLNFAIGLLSIGISFFISIFSTKIEDIKVYVVFWVIALVTTIGGIILFVVWRQANKSAENVIQRIKNRMSPITPDSNITPIVEQETGSQTENS